MTRKLVIEVAVIGPDANGYHRGRARLGELFCEVTVLPLQDDVSELAADVPHEAGYRITADGEDMGVALTVEDITEVLWRRLVPN